MAVSLGGLVTLAVGLFPKDKPTVIGRLDLAEGEFLHLTIEQRGLDLVAFLLDEGGRTRLRVDGLTGPRGIEEIAFVADQAGAFVVRVADQQGEPPPPGTFRWRITRRNRPREQDLRLAEAVANLNRAEGLRRARAWHRLGEAVEDYRRAREGFRILGRKIHEAEALFDLGRFLYGAGALEPRMRGVFEAAAALFEEVGETGLQAASVHYQGLAAYREEDWLGARELHQSAVDLQRQSGDQVGLANSANELALACQALGKFQEALGNYELALRIWEALGVRGEEYARVLHNQGVLLSSLGLRMKALEALERSVEVQRGLEHAPDLAATLSRLGLLHANLGDGASAFRALDEAWKLRKAGGNLRGEAVSLNHRGVAAWRLGNWAMARNAFSRSEGLFRVEGEERELARVLQWQGRVALSTGNLDEAESRFKKARRIFAAVEDPVGAAANELGVARLELRRGRLRKALEAARAAVNRLESLLPGTGSYPLAAAFQGDKQHFYDTLVEILVEIYRATGDLADADRALEADERGKARALLGLLREEGPGGAPRAELRTLSGEAIRGLVGDGTVFLSFRLTEERSFRFLVRAGGIEILDLPPRRKIEDLARQVYHMVPSRRRRSRARRDALLTQLGELLLDGLPQDLLKKRWVLMLDGALHYLPWSAIPWPGRAAPASPLALNRDLVQAPSASTLAYLRERDASRPLSSLSIAVLADPVFSPEDNRFAAMTQQQGHRSSEEEREDPLSRLEYSGLEADQIRTYFPPQGYWERRSFQANLAALREKDVSRSSILHLATHGRFGLESGALPRLFLSRFDRRGSQVPGMLTTKEIRELKLSCALVVLSACESGIGVERRGEGLVGLTQSFLDAGSSRVLVSLWPVEERSTATLMAAFYRDLVDSGDPVAALRRARLAVFNDPRFRDPFYWSGFVLTGNDVPFPLVAARTNPGSP